MPPKLKINFKIAICRRKNDNKKVISLQSTRYIFKHDYILHVLSFKLITLQMFLVVKMKRKVMIDIWEAPDDAEIESKRYPYLPQAEAV